MYLITHAGGYPGYDSAAKTANELKNFLILKGKEAYIDSEVADPTVLDPELVFAVGGDGTIMRAMKKFKSPVFGINAGTIGFLAGAENGQHFWESAINQVLKGDHMVENRLALCATIKRAKEPNESLSILPIANEVAVQHDQYPFDTQISVSGEVMWPGLFARGVMVATATGSPAWNFSSGGPLLFPESRDVALTPMNPQLASYRPFTLPQLGVGGSIEFEVQPHKDIGSTIQLIIDGERLEPLQFGDRVKITAAPDPLLLATFGLPQFFKALRKKGIAVGERERY